MAPGEPRLLLAGWLAGQSTSNTINNKPPWSTVTAWWQGML